MAPSNPTLTRRRFGGLGAAAVTLGALGAARSMISSASAQGTGPIKVGILHSLSGTMAISETTLKDVMLMLIEQQNAKGGLLGRKLEAVVVDPASNWPLFAEKAIPAVDYLMSENKVQRWVLAGTDYVYPRTTNQILEAYLKVKGVKQEDILINYTPFGHSDWQNIVASIKKFGSAGKKTAVVSTINGDANVPFYKELGNQGIKATDIPVVAFSVGEEELAGIDTKPLLGHLAAWNYFESVDNPDNKAFIDTWHKFTKNDKRTTNDPMEAHYIGFNMWVKGVEKAGTVASDEVIDAMIGVGDDAEPPHHQAGADRRNPRRRSVQHRLADTWPCRCAGMVAVRRGYQGPDRRLARPAVLRCVQREDRQVWIRRRQEGMMA